MEGILNACIHLTLENFPDPFSINIQIAEVETGNPLLMDSVKNVLNKYISLLVSVEFYYDIASLYN